MSPTDSATIIHPTAILDKKTKIGVGVTIGPYCHIGPEVIIHDHTSIDSHVRVAGKTTIGSYNRIFSFASIGTEPQDLKYKGEPCELIIKDHNTIREYSNFSIGTAQDRGLTQIGSHNLFMMNAHIAHDVMIQNHCIIANNCSFAGHVQVESHAVIGGHVAVHQHVRIGSYTMIGGVSGVSNDVPPYSLVAGNRARLIGLNMVGLKRQGFTPEDISEIKKIYQIVFYQKLSIEDAITKLKDNLIPHSQVMLDFIKSSNRGICR